VQDLRSQLDSFTDFLVHREHDGGLSSLLVDYLQSYTYTRGSLAVQRLEESYRLIRIAEPCLPRVVIVLLPAAVRNKIGHFHGLAWLAEHTEGRDHEVAIHPATFGQPEEVLNTLLHEAAHALLFEWGMNGGCGDNGYYHREEFKRVCEKLGLCCSFTSRRHGWNETTWPETGVPTRWEPVLDLLRTLPIGVEARQDRGTGRR